LKKVKISDAVIEAAGFDPKKQIQKRSMKEG